MVGSVVDGDEGRMCTERIWCRFDTSERRGSLPKAERDITLSTFVAQDIRDRRLPFRLSGGQLRHTCRSPAYHVFD
jgi:hypothetical protein